MSRNLSSRVTATHGSVRLHSSNEACDAMEILCYYKLNMKIKEKYQAGHTWHGVSNWAKMHNLATHLF